jgi:MscS family membrane protein
MLILDFFWILWSILDGLQGAIYKAISRLSPDLTTSLGGFILKILKILIWVLALSSVLSLWGINVTALIASLGLGGLAFALAAKDTAANLFGSIAILMDKSIKIGDWIKVDGVEGIVEDIGMRTTKVRTFYKSLVVVPNQIVANNPIENFSRRDKRRIKMYIGLTYDTTIEQVEKIVADIKDMLRKHPDIAQDETMLVNFDNFGDSAKEIFIYTFTKSAVWQEYLDIKEDVQYKIENIVKAHNSSFAFPSRSIYIESMPKEA